MATGRTEEKRRQVLNAARELFLEHGFDGTSTDAITSRARVSKETLYRYYRSKEELLVAVMQEMTVERFLLPATSLLLEHAGPADLEAALRRVLADALDRIMDPAYLALCRLAFGESGRRPKLVTLFRQGVPEAGGRALRGFLADGKRRGLLRADLDLGVAARVLVGPLLTWALMDGLMAGEARPRRPPVTALHEVVRIFLEGAAARQDAADEAGGGTGPRARRRSPGESQL